MPVEESGSIKTFNEEELEDIAQKALQFEEVGKVLKSKQSEINNISKQVNKDQKKVLKEVSGLKKQQKVEQRKIEQELKKITKENKKRGGIYAFDNNTNAPVNKNTPVDTHTPADAKTPVDVNASADADTPALPRNKDTKDFMKFRKEIDPNATWQDWINSQGRFKKAQNPKRAAGDSKIRPEIAEINPVEAILESLGIKKFQRKASKKSLVSAVGSPSKEGDNEFYAVRKRIEGLENGQKGMATFLTKTQSLLGGATGAAGSISNVGGMMQSPQGMASLAQVMFGGVANTLTTVGNPDTIKSVSKTMGGLARSVSSTLSIGNAESIGASTQSMLNGVMGKITSISSKLPIIGIAVTAAIAVSMAVVNAHLESYKAGGTRDIRLKQMAEDLSLIGVENDNTIFSGSVLFFSNPSRLQGLPSGRSNTQDLMGGISRYNLRTQGEY